MLAWEQGAFAAFRVNCHESTQPDHRKRELALLENIDLLRLYFAAPRILFLLTKVLFLSSSFSSASSARVLLLPSFRLCPQLATLACLPTSQPVPDAAYLRPCVPWIRALASWQDTSEEDRLHYPQAFIFRAGSQHLPQRGQGARKLRPHTFGGPLVSWNVLIVSLLQGGQRCDLRNLGLGYDLGALAWEGELIKGRLGASPSPLPSGKKTFIH